MATLSETKTRLSSITSTQKVVKAMELVASSKIKKSRLMAKNIEFFFESALENMKYLQSYHNKSLLFDEKSEDKTLLIVISSDMGLCGAYNASVNKEMINNIDDKTELVIIGKKALAKAEYEKFKTLKYFVDYNKMTEIELTTKVMEVTKEKIKNKEINNVKIIYTKFINPISQEVDIIDFKELNDTLVAHKKDKSVTLIEPSSEEVFENFFDSYLKGIIYSSILQSFASEHAYRRNSMENANNNSLELIDKLNIEINRIRQANITQEITEIISGSESLNKE